MPIQVRFRTGWRGGTDDRLVVHQAAELRGSATIPMLSLRKTFETLRARHSRLLASPAPASSDRTKTEYDLRRAELDLRRLAARVTEVTQARHHSHDLPW